MRGISMDKEWQAEEDMRTLVRAEEVRKDPKRLKAAQAIAKKRADELKGLMPEKSTKN